MTQEQYHIAYSELEIDRTTYLNNALVDHVEGRDPMPRLDKAAAIHVAMNELTVKLMHDAQKEALANPITTGSDCV